MSDSDVDHEVKVEVKRSSVASVTGTAVPGPGERGEMVVAYLNAHPEAVKSPARVFDHLARLGWKPSASLTEDIDGNGVPEFVFVTKSSELWLVTKGAHGWIARVVKRDIEALESSVTLPHGKGRAIIYRNPPNTSPTKCAFTWDGGQVMAVDPTTLAPKSE